MSGTSEVSIAEEAQSMNAVKRNINNICISMVVLSCALIAIMLITVHFQKPSDIPAPAGWVAVVGAAIVFGSTGVPMKSPIMASLQVDSFVFALYTSVGIFLVSFPLFVYLLATNKFVFVPWAVLGAADIVIIGYLAFLAVQSLGYAKAPAIWAGCGMTCAFLWGALAFDESISNLGMAVAAISLLVVGVYCVSTSQASTESTDCDINNHVKSLISDGFDLAEIGSSEYSRSNPLIDKSNLNVTPIDVECPPEERKEGDDLAVDIPPPTEREAYSKVAAVSPTARKCADPITEEARRPETLHAADSHLILTESTSSSSQSKISREHDETIGSMLQLLTMKFQGAGAYLLCFAVGFCDGSLMVPFKLSRPRPGDIDDVFRYLASFGISSIVVAPVLFFMYCFIFRGGAVPQFHFHAAFIPGVSSGILWAAANFMSVHATFYLGIKIGFPLTQTCVLIAAFWGVVYFREFDLRRSGYIYRFSTGILSIIIGAYLLGASG